MKEEKNCELETREKSPRRTGMLVESGTINSLPRRPCVSGEAMHFSEKLLSQKQCKSRERKRRKTES